MKDKGRPQLTVSQGRKPNHEGEKHPIEGGESPIL